MKVKVRLTKNTTTAGSKASHKRKRADGIEKDSNASP